VTVPRPDGTSSKRKSKRFQATSLRSDRTGVGTREGTGRLGSGVALPPRAVPVRCTRPATSPPPLGWGLGPGHVVRALRAAPAVSSVLPVPTDRMGPNRSRTGTAHISEIIVRLPCCARLARPRVCVCAVAGGARAPWRVARARRRPVTGFPSTGTGTGTGSRCGRVGSSQARSRQGPRGAPSQEPRRPWSVPWSVRARARRAGEARERRAGAQIRRRSDTCGSGWSSLHAWLLSMLFPLVVRVCHV
jgi:hypothetical protein